MGRGLVRVGGIMAAAGVLIVVLPIWGNDGALTVLGGAAMLVVGVVFLALGLVATRRWWAMLTLVGACVYGVALMLPHGGQRGGIERACASWLEEAAPPQVREAIDKSPDAGWANGPDGISTSYLPAGRVCTFAPPDLEPVRLTPSWTMTLVAASFVLVAALGSAFSRAFARRPDTTRP